jgi:transposase IS116/IS110/IS902 family protein
LEPFPYSSSPKRPEIFGGSLRLPPGRVGFLSPVGSFGFRQGVPFSSTVGVSPDTLLQFGNGCRQPNAAGNPVSAQTYVVTVPGVAETSALQILGELVVLPDSLDARQWVAFSGLDPSQFTSGTSVDKRPRISRGGSRHLRRALYMPALVALRRDPHLAAFYQRLLARGKARLQAVVAVMRKLLHALFAMFRLNQSYDESRLCRAELASCSR